jgi:hypothetical protein
MKSSAGYAMVRMNPIEGGSAVRVDIYYCTA